MLGFMQQPNVYVTHRLDPPLVSQTVYVPVQYDEQTVRLEGSQVNVRYSAGPATGSCEQAQIALALLNMTNGEVAFAVPAAEYARRPHIYLPVIATKPFERGLQQILQDGLSVACIAQISLISATAPSEQATADAAATPAAAASAMEAPDSSECSAAIRSEFSSLHVMTMANSSRNGSKVRDRVLIDDNNALDLVCAARVTETDGGYIQLNESGQIVQIDVFHRGAREPAFSQQWTAAPEAVFVKNAAAMAMPFRFCTPQAAAVSAVARCGVANCWVAPVFVPRALDVDGQLADLTEVEPLPFFDRRLSSHGIVCLRAEPAFVRSCPAVNSTELTQAASYILLNSRSPNSQRLRTVANIIAPDPQGMPVEL